MFGHLVQRLEVRLSYFVVFLFVFFLSPALTVSRLLLSCSSLLSDPNPDDPLDPGKFLESLWILYTIIHIKPNHYITQPMFNQSVVAPNSQYQLAPNQYQINSATPTFFFFFERECVFVRIEWWMWIENLMCFFKILLINTRKTNHSFWKLRRNGPKSMLPKNVIRLVNGCSWLIEPRELKRPYLVYITPYRTWRTSCPFLKFFC